MESESREPGPSGLLGSLRGFADGLIGSAHDRLELLAVELHEEKFRLIQIFIWISAIVFLAMLAMIFVSLAIVMIFWETAKVAVICGFAVAYTAGLIAAVVAFSRYLKTQPKPFAGTLNELKEDRECIRAQN
jgi:uncharacterized membrane protein YqjE